MEFGKGKIIILAVILVAAGVLGARTGHSLQPVEDDDYDPTEYFTMDNVPTFFIHGLNSSSVAMDFMVNEFREFEVTENVIYANVTPEGKVSLVGKVVKGAGNPIIEINFENNRQRNYHIEGQWLKSVIDAYREKNHFDRFNVVAHSMGNMAICYYQLDYGDDPDQPKLHKVVDIAGNYDRLNGHYKKWKNNKLDKDGKPKYTDSVYRELLGLKTMDVYKNVDVLNIYGDLEDGSGTDGRVSTVSAKSFKYIIKDSAKSYKEIEFKGKMAGHRMLHHNYEVSDDIMDFLWAK